MISPADRIIMEDTLRGTLRHAEFQWADPRGDGLQLVLTIAADDFHSLSMFDRHARVRQALQAFGDRQDSLVLRTILPSAGFPLS